MSGPETIVFDPHVVAAIALIALAAVVALLLVCIDPGVRRGRRNGNRR